MANNTNANCEPCNITATVAVAPPPTCPVPACEELVPTECVINNLIVDEGCTSEFYQYGSDGSLVLQNGVPVSQNPAIPLGLTITQGQNLNTILTNLVDAQNCVLTPNFIAGMLQIIQNNPTHPVAQIFCNLVCSCQPCDEPCDPLLTVEQVVFNPVQQTSVEFTFYAQTGVTYEFIFVNTSTLPPTTTTYSNYTPTVGNQDTTVDTSTLTGFPDLIAGSSYQLFINATTVDGGFSCPNGSWYFSTPADPACDCEDIILTYSFESAAVDYIDMDINYLVVPGQTVPLQYRINITCASCIQPGNLPGTLPGMPIFINVTGATTNFVYPGPPGTLIPGEYSVFIQPVCSISPILCLGEEVRADIELTGTVICDPPVITGVTIVP